MGGVLSRFVHRRVPGRASRSSGRGGGGGAEPDVPTTVGGGGATIATSGSTTRACDGFAAPGAQARRRGGLGPTNADEDSHGSCELLAHATEASRAKWGLGGAPRLDGIPNQLRMSTRCYIAARASAAVLLARAAWRRRDARHTRTANALEGACPRWARGRRRWRRLCASGSRRAAHPPQPRAVGPALAAASPVCWWCREFERLVGWVSRRTPPGTSTPRCAAVFEPRRAVAWLDAGVHVPVARRVRRACPRTRRPGAPADGGELSLSPGKERGGNLNLPMRTNTAPLL